MARTQTGDWNDTDFASEVLAARVQGPRLGSMGLLFAIVLFFVAAFIWADNAVIDEVTRGEGRVIPSSQVQVVQNLEGGILKEILVQEGAIVEAGQVLIRIDDTGFASRYGELKANFYTLMGEVARLESESKGSPLTFPPELMAEAREIAVSERNLFNARQAELQSQIIILRQQADQRKQEVAELASKINQLQESVALAKEEMTITEPLVETGVVPRISLIRLKREANDLRGQINASRLAMPRARAAVREANQRIEEKYLNFRSAALTVLSGKQAEFSAVDQSILAAKDRVTRTEVRSPVKGVVKEIKKQTVGGVLRPGEDIAEIVPLEDSLLVEAKIRPADIAFLSPGQEATVKLTAYDFSIYGGLPGKLVRISADTITDDKEGSYYKIIVRTEKNYLMRGDERLPIIPGMVASVDTLTGKKSVLDYILKPILKTRDRALRER